jgi:hypothetical protein
MTKKQTEEGWGDVTEREVALYAIYDVLNNGKFDDMIVESVKANYPNLSLPPGKKAKLIEQIEKNLCRIQRVIVKSLEAYDYEIKDCNSE